MLKLAKTLLTIIALLVVIYALARLSGADKTETYKKGADTVKTVVDVASEGC